MQFEDLIASITPDIYQNMLRAIETGRWPDGRTVTEAQREHCMTAVIAWGERHLPSHERVGFIDRGVKAEGEVCASDHDHDDAHEEKPIRFV
jgi:uncharacterized protein YeaC (DUF1315 family)